MKWNVSIVWKTRIKETTLSEINIWAETFATGLLMILVASDTLLFIIDKVYLPSRPLSTVLIIHEQPLFTVLKTSLI